MGTRASWAALLLFGGCVGVGGDGHEVDRSVPVDAFTSVAVDDALVVHLSLGAPSAIIQGEGGLVERVELRRRGLGLEVSVKDDELLDADIPLIIRLTTPALVRVEAAEASVVQLTGIIVPELTLVSVEGSQIRARGRVDALTVRGATAADIDARGLEADDVQVEGGGASTLAVFARRAVRGTLTDHSALVVLGGGAVDAVEVEHDAELSRGP